MPHGRRAELDSSSLPSECSFLPSEWGRSKMEDELGIGAGEEVWAVPITALVRHITVLKERRKFMPRASKNFTTL